jgi:SsrA-binding protein
MSKLVVNKKATFNFEILERLSAGIELFGFEVKSLRNKLGKLEGSHITVRGGEAFLLNSTIPPYQPGNIPQEYDPERNRRLLLTKKEIKELESKLNQAGLTLVPLSLYNKGKLIKLEIALVRGKKKHDKRESIKKRDIERDIKRTLKY